jgi:hypothetical protein
MLPGARQGAPRVHAVPLGASRRQLGVAPSRGVTYNIRTAVHPRIAALCTPRKGRHDGSLTGPRSNGQTRGRASPGFVRLHRRAADLRGTQGAGSFPAPENSSAPVAARTRPASRRLLGPKGSRWSRLWVPTRESRTPARTAVRHAGLHGVDIPPPHGRHGPARRVSGRGTASQSCPTRAPAHGEPQGPGAFDFGRLARRPTGQAPWPSRPRRRSRRGPLSCTAPPGWGGAEGARRRDRAAPRLGGRPDRWDPGWAWWLA